MGDHHLPHELSRLCNYCEETLPTQIKSVTEKLIPEVMDLSFLRAFCSWDLHGASWGIYGTKEVLR